ncbi:class I SAM-dependent methyltransferase [Candidatus Pacearchaeota archaeon]|nr:class I SAM-dependent methyltransferase [Candidatus Pacearchaeota archaeon]
MPILEQTQQDQSSSILKKAISIYTSDLAEIEERQRILGNEINLDLQGLVNESTDKIEESCFKFETQFNGDPKELSEMKKQFRTSIHPWYSQSWLMTQATTKPKGFPGDFKLLERIYENVPVISGADGNSQNSQGVGLYLDRWFLDSHLAHAVRSRKNFMRDYLTLRLKQREKPLCILNLASGPCREWQELSENLDLNGVKLIGVDIDKEALEYTKLKLKGMTERGLELNASEDNILKMALRKIEPVKDKYGLQDLVYSIGLFDYLPDNMLAKVVTRGYDLLKQNGKMVLAFKDKEMYRTTRYDWMTDWTFQPRNQTSITQFLQNNGYASDQTKFFREPLNTIIFYEITKS